MRAIKNLLLHLFERVGGFHLLHQLKKNDPIILMYHRIIEDQFVNGLTPDEFEQQIIYLNKHYNVMHIDELINNLRDDKVKPYSLALTFDDGHYDFYAHAWPILKKYKIPASIYITTGFVDGTEWLWPDLLKYILVNGKASQLDIGKLGAAHIGLLAADDHLANWHKLGDYCLTLKPKDRQSFFSALAQQANVVIPHSPQAPFHSVTWPQLNEMVKDGLDIGSHTVSHPILSLLDRESIDYELGSSAKIIEQNLGVFPKGICYPNGRPEDINHDVIRAAKELGYTYGLMGRKSKLNKTSLFRIGRIAANKNFFYFKWTLARRQQDNTKTYIP